MKHLPTRALAFHVALSMHAFGIAGCTEMLTDPTDTASDVNITSDDASAPHNDTGADVLGLDIRHDTAPGWVAVPASDADAMQAKLDQALLDLQLSGAAFAVAQAGTNTLWVGSAGVGNTETQSPWLADSRFRIGSATKTFTTALILMLVDDNALSLDDSLETWVPGYYDGVGVTVRHLLANTSGIPSYNYVGSFPRNVPWTPAELVQWAVTHGPDLHFAPGSQYEYSNTNFVLLGLIVEAATGKTYEAVIAERITGPLGLADTYVAGTGDTHPKLVSSYDAQGNDLTLDYDSSFGWAAGSIVSTPTDLARWGAIFYDGQLLSPATQAEMLTPIVFASGDVSMQGLGVFIERDGTDELYGHTGGIGGYLTYLFFWKATRTALVATVNVQDVNLRDLAGYGWAIPLGIDYP